MHSPLYIIYMCNTYTVYIYHSINCNSISFDYLLYSKYKPAATLLHHTRSYYNYISECLLVSSVGCYRILCELSETGPWSSPSGDSTV